MNSIRLVVHVTTVHPRTDIRIRIKEIAALTDRLKGCSVTLFVQDGEGSRSESGEAVNVIDTGRRPRGRLARMTIGAWRMWHAVHTVGPSVVHFHDPELIPVGLALKTSGIKVIYDVHEDLPRQILSKYWIPAGLRWPVSWAAEAVEWLAARMFDGIVAATPTIARRFPAEKTVTVQNFPILNELILPCTTPYAERPPHFAYVGGISVIRGAWKMLAAIEAIGDERVVLQLAGAFTPAALETEARGHPAWCRVDFHGWAARERVANLLGNVRAGLVCFLPERNHTSAQPNKMFEYMAAGLPVIASDFPLWRQIVNDARCGVLVDPENPTAIAAAMQWLLDHPEEAEAMGQRGRKAVEETYNWKWESEKLISVYWQLLDSP